MPVIRCIVGFFAFAQFLSPALGAQQFLVEVEPEGRPAGTRPVDVDRDGLPDLLVVQAERLMLHRNLGLGRYAPPVSITPALPLSWHVAAADFDGDNDVDLVALAAYQFGSPGVDVHLLTQSNLTFTATTIGQVPTPSAPPAFVRALDLEGDGDPDLVLGASGGQLLSQVVLRNDGGGVFTNVTAQWFAGIGFAGYEVIVLDVDGDGRQDLLYGFANGGSRLLRNIGTRFVDETATRLPGHMWLYLLAAGDVDGDNDVDVLASDHFTPVKLLENQGGTFVAVPSFPTISLPSAVTALVDVEGDGDLDACVVDHTTQQLTFAINNGGGTFGVPVVGPSFEPDTGNLHLAAPDQDGDGDPDLMLLGRNTSLLVNDGAGNFASRPTSQSLPAHAGIAADVDGDGDLDLFGPNFHLHYEQNGEWSTQPTSGTAEQPRSLDQLGDIDGDGDLDIVTSAVFVNLGSGLFALNPGSGFPQPSTSATALGDFDLDGDLDIVAVTGALTAATVRLYHNNGSGLFAAGAVLATGTGFRVSVDDADADGRPDIVVTDILASGYVLQNTVNGWVTLPLPPLFGTDRLEFAQFGGSALPDLVAVGATTRVFRQQGGAFVEVTSTVLPAGFGGPSAIGDYENDGDLDLVGVDILRNDGAGNFTLVPAGLPEPPVSLADIDGDLDLDAVMVEGVLWNRERHVLLPLPPKVGQNLRLEITSRPGSAFLDFAVLGMAFTSRPVGLPLPIGLLFLDNPLATLFFPFPNAVGVVELNLPVPNQPGFVGVELHAQSFHWNPLGVGLGNLAIGRVQ